LLLNVKLLQDVLKQMLCLGQSLLVTEHKDRR